MVVDGKIYFDRPVEATPSPSPSITPTNHPGPEGGGDLPGWPLGTQWWWLTVLLIGLVGLSLSSSPYLSAPKSGRRTH